MEEIHSRNKLDPNLMTSSGRFNFDYENLNVFSYLSKTKIVFHLHVFDFTSADERFFQCYCPSIIILLCYTMISHHNVDHYLFSFYARKRSSVA